MAVSFSITLGAVFVHSDECKFYKMASDVDRVVAKEAPNASDINPVDASLPKSSPSIVADVLGKKGLSTATSVNQAMKELSLKTDGLKSQIYGFIYKEYTELYHEFNQGVELNKKLAKLVRESNKLGDDIENDTLVTMETSGSELKRLTDDYEKNQELIKTLKKLLKMNDCIQTCAHGLHCKEYLRAARATKDLRAYLNDLSAGICDIKIFKAIREEYRLKKAFIVSELESAWYQAIEWDTVTTVSWDSVQGHLRTSLKINEPDVKSHGIESLNSLYEAMDCVGILDSRVTAFAKKMLNFLLKPLIKFVSLKPIIENNKVRLVKEDTKIKGKKVDIVSVYRKLFAVLQFMAKVIFPALEKKADNEEKSEEKAQNESADLNILEKLRSYVWPDLSDLIIKECLATAVPYNNTQLNEYDQIIKWTRNFEQELCTVGFLDESSTVLSTYAENINVHFANKKVQDLLVKARDLMTSEMHSMIKVEVDEDRARLVTEINENEQKFSMQTRLLLAGLKDIPDSCLGTKIFQFPECQISESTKKLMNLAYDTMLEASTATPQVAIQLFYSVRNMFELFCNIVPVYHKETLELPQMAALHYNNAMYLAHHCVTMGHQFKPTLPDTLGQAAATFVDYVPVLRNCGQKIFLDNLKKQKETLLEILRKCNSFTDLEDRDSASLVQKSFEQIINHLVRLGRVWRDVLPKHIYEKVLPLLLHTVLDTIISQIIQLEDISADQGKQFYRLLSILSKRSSEIFNLRSKDEESTDDMGFIVHIPSWQKFNEMIQIMESSLQGILDRWANGKGPLAQCFEASDVRSLIKALFQNTNIRAQVLSKIKQT